jgi:cytoskeletal protein CcmA (bactofilin family)
MRIERGKTEGSTILSEDLMLSGMWVGDCNVTSGASLTLLGTVTGDLTVDADSSADVDGIVNGNLHAHGSVTLRGVVHGRAMGDGLDVYPGAKVEGQTI